MDIIRLVVRRRSESSLMASRTFLRGVGRKRFECLPRRCFLKTGSDVVVVMVDLQLWMGMNKGVEGIKIS